MKVKLKRSAWTRHIAINPSTYGLDYDRVYEVEYVKEYDNNIKSYKLVDKWLYDADYFEVLSD